MDHQPTTTSHYTLCSLCIRTRRVKRFRRLIDSIGARRQISGFHELSSFVECE
jgi:hypothetical protein